MSVHERSVGKGKNSVVPQRCQPGSSASDRMQSLQIPQPRTQMIHFTKPVHLHEVMEQQDGRLGLLCKVRVLPPGCTTSSDPPRVSIMATKTRRAKGRDGVSSSLDMVVESLDHAKEGTRVASAVAAFASAGVLLTIIRVGSFPVHVGRLPAHLSRTRWLTSRNMSNWG